MTITIMQNMTSCKTRSATRKSFEKNALSKAHRPLYILKLTNKLNIFFNFISVYVGLKPNKKKMKTQNLDHSL